MLLSLRNRPMVKNTLLLTASILALRALGVGFQGYLSGRIGAEGMGVLQLVLTVGALAGTLGSSGVRVAAMQLVAREHGRRSAPGVIGAVSACLRYAVIVSMSVGLGLILLSGWLGSAVLKDARTALALRTLGLLLPFGCLCGVMSGYFTATGKVRRLVAVELLERLCSIGLTLLLLLWAGAELSRVCCAVIGGSFGGAALSLGILYGMYRRDRREARVQPLPMGGEVIRLCVPLAVNDYLRSGLSSVEQFLIPFGLEKYGSRSAGLAAYGTISGMVFPVLWFPAAILYAVADLLVPELARCLATKNRVRMLRLTSRCFAWTAAFAVAVAVGLYLSGGFIGRTFFHSEAAGRYIRLFSPMVLFLYLDHIVDGMQKGLGQQLFLVRYNSFTNLLDVIGLYTLLPRFGVGGYVFTYAFTHLVNFFLSFRRLLIAVDAPCLPPRERIAPA